MNTLIFRWFNGLAGLSPFGDRLIIFAADYLGYVLIATLVVYFIFYHRQSALFISAAGLISWLLAHLIKYFYASPRPFLVLTDLQPLIRHGGNDSFPSGHAAFFMALGSALYLSNKKLGQIYILGAVLISLARVAAGIHWPLDILAGWALAWLVVGLVKFSLPRARL